VAEAAVVGKPHEIKGEAIFAYVVCRGARPTHEVQALTQELREWVAKELGAIAKPEEIRFADNLPKTRSGKIMRRLLRALARGEEISQDVSTLENPAILEQLRGVEPETKTPGAPATGKPQAAPPARAHSAKQPGLRKAAAKKNSVRRPAAKKPRAARVAPKKGNARRPARSARARPSAPKKRAHGKKLARKSARKKR
jgi:hypothetical protein